MGHGGRRETPTERPRHSDDGSDQHGIKWCLVYSSIDVRRDPIPSSPRPSAAPPHGERSTTNAVGPQRESPGPRSGDKMRTEPPASLGSIIGHTAIPERSGPACC